MKKSAGYFFLIVILLAFTSIYSRSLAHTEQIPLQKELSRFPEHIGVWRGKIENFSPDVLRKLGTNDVLNRTYLNPEGNILWLYIGYYRKQQSGNQIHSPLHCYPGSGWDPILHQVITVRLQDRVIHINQMMIQRGAEKRMVAYWYQSQEKVIARELLQRLNLLVTAFQKHRTDGSLIRISMAVYDDSPEETWKEIVSFMQEMYPQLATYLPQ